MALKLPNETEQARHSAFVASAPQPPTALATKEQAQSAVAKTKKPKTPRKKRELMIQETIYFPLTMHAAIEKERELNFKDFSNMVRDLVLEALRVRNEKRQQQPGT
jgi:hypothetical protein